MSISQRTVVFEPIGTGRLCRPGSTEGNEAEWEAE